MTMKEFWKLAFWCVMFLLLAIALYAIATAVSPAFVNWQTQINLHSDSATRSNAEQMTAYVNAYYELDIKKAENPAVASQYDALQKNYVKSICSEYNLTPADMRNMLPENVLQFIQMHPCH